MVAARSPVQPPSLRPYQVDAIAALRREVAAGHKRSLLVMPTGGGKTLVAAEIIRSAVAKNRRALFLIHRKELADQALDKLSRFGVPAGLIMGQDARRDDWLPVQVCSVQTLARRMDRLPAAELIIQDEAHHAMSDSWRKLIEAYADATVIGLTATPWRSDRVGLSDMFTSHVIATTTAELVTQGFLVEADYFAYDAPDLHKVPLSAGDYRKKDLDIACNTKVLVGAIVREYMKHGHPRPGIVFPVSIEHSKAIVAEFGAEGVVARHVDCFMTTGERGAAIRDFEAGTVQVLSSVGVLSEGFDAPRAEVAMLARPTQSLTLHIQQVGRVLRPSPATGKTRALVHCHAGNVVRHGPPEEIVDYSPDSTPERVLERRTCPMCFAIISRTIEGRCPVCGEPIRPVVHKPDRRGMGREMMTVDGVRIDAAAIRKMRERLLGVSDRAMTDAQIAKVMRATREEKAAEYLRLRDVASRKGLKKGFVWWQFKSVFGHGPGFGAEELAGVEPAAKPFLPLPPRGTR